MPEKKYWFKAKLYGWGWCPASKEGWLITVLFVIAVFLLVPQYVDREADTIDPMFFVVLFVLIIAMTWIAYKKGEKPRWRWGK